MTADNPNDFLLALNNCWQTGDLAALAEYYHPDVVLLPPDMGEPIRGRQAVIESYQDFLEAATLEHFDAYEDFLGYDAAGSLYRRSLVSAITRTGPTLAWTYIYLGDPEDFPLIPSGRWTGA